MPAIQFYGKDQVMQAAENMDCPAWAIYVGRQLFMKFEGGAGADSLAFLDSALELLGQNETTGIYTIKFFETEGESKIKINEKTICTAGSFNFKLIDPQNRAVVQYGGQVGYTAHLGKTNQDLEKLTQIVAQQQEMLAAIMANQTALLNGSDDDDDDEEEPETIQGVIIDTLKNPEKLNAYLGMISNFIGMQQNNNIGAAAIGGTGYAAAGNSTAAPQQQQAQTSMTEEEAQQRFDRLGKAVDFLLQVDPQFVEHLEQLVEMEKKKPGKLKSLLAWL